ncbi:hypothetical protein EYF80_047913 [Liparis tanakae]|uniref:Uncharacterized protein n=1 Tax=Liparis tanakae TaxID=230148 RepID=A0A4Z2FKZ9_9TELE|nr:hypothetical protein EYF80_047913 [Liparis tanakae]
MPRPFPRWSGSAVRSAFNAMAARGYGLQVMARMVKVPAAQSAGAQCCIKSPQVYSQSRSSVTMATAHNTSTGCAFQHPRSIFKKSLHIKASANREKSLRAKYGLVTANLLRRRREPRAQKHRAEGAGEKMGCTERDVLHSYLILFRSDPSTLRARLSPDPVLLHRKTANRLGGGRGRLP